MGEFLFHSVELMILPLVLAYLGGSFLCKSFNPNDWKGDLRFIPPVVFVVAWGVFAMAWGTS